MKPGNRLITAATSIAVLSVALSLPAAAHPGHLGHESLAAGLAHPLSGLDHLLTMISIGAMAVMQHGRARLAIPAAFMGFMVAGALLGLAGATLPFYEIGIAGLGVLVVASVVLLRGLPVSILLPLASLTGLLHGMAHGMELLPGGDAAAFIAGFVATTAALMAAGAIAAAVAGGSAQKTKRAEPR